MENKTEFKGLQKSFTYKQINNASPEKVFPLLCPEREKDWLDGWDYTMIHSESGYAEKGCVFSTSHHTEQETIWYINEHDRENFKIEFIRFTPYEEIVKINIKLTDNGNNTTTSEISYQYSALTENKNEWMLNEFEKSFTNLMIWWEKSINHYLDTGKMLKKQ
jgi:hypothetical protein